jgi:RNA polymerase sigma factor (sigma-70 family)
MKRRIVIKSTGNEHNQEGLPLIEHIDGLYGYALSLTHNHSGAEDLVQEAYVRAINAMDRLREDSNIRGWLFTILRNIWFNQIGKRRSSPEIIEIDGIDGIADCIVEPSKIPMMFTRARSKRSMYKRLSGACPPNFERLFC